VKAHPHARLLLCARRLYDREPVDAKWIVQRFKIGIAAARRDIRWLRMYLPVRIRDGGRGRGRTVRLLSAHSARARRLDVTALEVGD